MLASMQRHASLEGVAVPVLGHRPSRRSTALALICDLTVTTPFSSEYKCFLEADSPAEWVGAG